MSACIVSLCLVCPCAIFRSLCHSASARAWLSARLSELSRLALFGSFIPAITAEGDRAAGRPSDKTTDRAAVQAQQAADHARKRARSAAARRQHQSTHEGCARGFDEEDAALRRETTCGDN